MNDIEQDLKRTRRAAPSDALDARVQRTLTRPAGALSRPVPLWACALLVVLGVLSGGVIFRHPTPEPVHVILPAPSEARVVLVASADAGLPSSPFIGRRFVESTKGTP